MAEDIAKLLANDEQLNEATKTVFDAIDTDSSGEIDRSEFRVALAQLAEDLNLSMPSNDDIDESLKKLDTDRSGTLNVNEFKTLVRELLQALIE